VLLWRGKILDGRDTWRRKMAEHIRVVSDGEEVILTAEGEGGVRYG
jgi:antitoxin (DNA-binding transcriptional repressor) of toxin-antitoxin stability system